jgi:tetratricopeptide (TPR) repeat protein
LLLIGGVLGGVVALAGGGLLVTRQLGRGPRPAPPLGSYETRAVEAAFVGHAVCGECHPEQNRRWRGSHHDLAMQVTSEKTVLGRFANATFTHRGVTSTFFRRDGKYLVRTDGPDGRLHEYEIAYTFGVTPLQQYLVAFPGGRYQALGVAWDSRPREAGGQRWFHLYPGERLAAGAPLHWTGVDQTWNYQCAECHSTGLRKGYREDGDRYETTWSELNVACEACHGPGSAHVAWARAGGMERPRSAADAARGLLVRLHDRDDRAWTMDPGKGTVTRTAPVESRAEVETCARCHARRGVLHDRYVHGRPLLDTHRPALLEAGLYHADGQIRDEVYEYGSFLQSRMYRAGVTCSDCHDPHSLRPRAEGNALCTRCHRPQRFDTAAHHFHRPGGAGARCVECHMPARLYMVIDPRRDHSLRVPRPDLSVKLGMPEPCTGCHRDRTTRWAADTVARWYGRRERPPHYGEVLQAARAGQPAAREALQRLAEDASQPGIVRATAVSLLPRYPGPASLAVLERAARDPDPLVRAATASALESLEPAVRLALASPLLQDQVRGVRIEAGRALAAVAADQLTPEQRAARDRALDEYRYSLAVNADRPEGRLGQGVLHAHLGRLDAAEQAYRKAIRIDPTFGPAYVNLADLLRVRGRDGDGVALLREALTVVPGDAAVHHALGLALARQQRLPAALAALERAAELRPEEARYGYVLGVGLNSAGQPDRALTVLARAHERHPGDREILLALATISRDRGRLDAARRYAEKLVQATPDDAAARSLLADLEARR